MRGPFLPIYGSGAIMMLAASMPFRGNIVLTYISGMLGATALEYVTGVLMEALFKVRYWDYSRKRFHYKGHICLSSSIAWGFLTILMTEIIHTPIADAVLSMPESLFVLLTFALTVVLVIDFTLSFKAAMELRAELISMEKVKEELHILQRRLDVIIAVADNAHEERKQERELRTEELIAHIKLRLEESGKRLLAKQNEHMEGYQEEIAQLRMRFYENVGKIKEHRHLSRFYTRHIFLNNPTMVSEKFKSVLEELKEAVKKPGNEQDGISEQEEL